MAGSAQAIGALPARLCCQAARITSAHLIPQRKVHGPNPSARECWPQLLLNRTVARGLKGCWSRAQASIEATRVVTSRMKPCS